MRNSSSELMQAEPHRPAKRSAGAGRAARVFGALVLVAVLGLAFAGHLSPDMKLQWENLMALCGF